MRKEEHLSSNLILSYSAGTFHRKLPHYYRMAYNLLLLPKSVAVILRKGVKGRKKNLMDQRTKQMVRLKAVEPSQFSRKFALEGCAELVISRGGEGREGLDGRKDAEEGSDGCSSDVFQRDSPARSSSKSIFLHYTVISGVNRPD